MSIGQLYEPEVQERGLVQIKGSFAPNGSSAISQASIKGKGIASVERTGVGCYLLKLADRYPDYRALIATLQLNAAANQQAQIGNVNIGADVSYVQCAFDLTAEKIERTAHGLSIGQKVIFSEDSSLVTKTWVACTGTESTNKINKNGHGLEAGEIITFRNLTGGAGITAGTRYYVVSPGANDFEISLTLGGGAVNFTTDMTAGEYAKDCILPVGELAAGTEYFIVATGTNDFQVSATAGGSAITLSSGGIASYTVVSGILIRVVSAGSGSEVAAHANNRVNFEAFLKVVV